MSLIVTVHTNEGIVMASDSRVSFTTNSVMKDEDQNIKETTTINSHVSDTAYKTFVSGNNVGISIAGDCTINNSSITGYMEEFLRMYSHASVEEMPQFLLSHFKELDPSLNTQFHVAGYVELENQNHIPKFYRVYTADGTIEEVDTQNSGAAWSGEYDILGKVITQVYDEDGNPIQHYDILWQYFTLQDAVDFVKYAIQTTIDTMKFQNRPKTVGGPIDILLIRPEGAEWLARKEIHP